MCNCPSGEAFPVSVGTVLAVKHHLEDVIQCHTMAQSEPL